MQLCLRSPGVAGATLDRARFDNGLAIAHISAVAAGMTCTDGTVGVMFGALAEAQFNIRMIATNEIHTSCLAPVAEDIMTLQIAHEGFAAERRFHSRKE